MRCPKCGNSELQAHHRFCFQCGHLNLDADKRSEKASTAIISIENSSEQTASEVKSSPADLKTVLEEGHLNLDADKRSGKASTATTSIENSTEQTASEVKSSPAEGQLLDENSQFSNLVLTGDKGKKELEEQGGEVIVIQDEHGDSEEPVKRIPDQKASNVCPTGQEEIHLTDHGHEASGTTITRFPIPSQVSTSRGLDDQNDKNITKQETRATAEGMLPHQAPQIPTEPQTEEKDCKQQETEAPMVTAFAVEGLACTEVRHDTSGGISKNATPVSTENEDQTTDHLPDAVQNSKEQKEEARLGEEIGAVSGKVTSMVIIDQTGNDAVGAITLKQNAGKETVKPEEERPNIRSGNEAKDFSVESQPHADDQGPARPSSTQNLNGTNGRGQRSENANGAVATTNNAQSNLPKTTQRDPKEPDKNTFSQAGHQSNPSQGIERQNLDKEFVTLIFHALLTPTFSINFHHGDKVCLRGDPPFSWRAEKQVEMHVVREVSSGYYVLKGEIKLSLRDAHRKISYKYIIVRSKAKDLWECLIGFKPVVSGHVNRCLTIPEKSIKNNATWHQYDDAVFSEPGFWESICNHVPLLKNITQNPAEGRRMAMLAMLPDWDNISTMEGQNSMSAHAALTEINGMVYCMSKAEYENGGYYFPRTLIGFNVMEVLCEYFSPRLNLNVQILQVKAEDKDSRVKRLITSAIIVSLVNYYNMTFLRDDLMRDLVECLALIGDPDRKRCSEFDAILRHFPKMEHLSILANSLLWICNYIIKYRPGILHWLFAVPLLHFLSGSAKPFSANVLSSAPSSVKDDSWWGTQDMTFQDIRKRAEMFSTSSPVHLLLQLTLMFEVDPLFKRTFLLTLPICDIAIILQKRIFSLYEVCWTLTRVVEERDVPYLSDEEWTSLDHCIKEMYNDIGELDRVDKSQDEEIMSLAQATSYLLHHLLTAHGLAIQKRLLVLCGIFQLLGRSLMLAKVSSFLDESGSKSSKGEKCTEIFQEAFQCLRGCMEEQFGGTMLASENCCQEEFQVWSTLLSVKNEDEEFQQFWEHGVKDALKSRISRIDQTRVIELFCKLDLRTCHHEIKECFMSAVCEAVDHLVEGGIKEEHMASLSSKLETSSTDRGQNSVVSKLFALLLKRCWPKEKGGKEPSEDELLQHILSWKPMAKYFQYFGYPSQQSATLPADGLDLLVSASSLLEHVGLRLMNAKIDVNTLQIVEKNRASFLKLYSLQSQVEDSTESSEDTVASLKNEVTGSQQKTSSIEIFLHMRIEELEAFEKERDAVRCFVEMCSLVQSDVDLDEFKEKLNKDPPSCQMVELCHKRSTGDEPVVKFFNLTAKNKRMVQSLHHVRASLLFLTFWQKCLQKAPDLCKDSPGPNKRLTVDQVQEFVWTPCNQRWRDLWGRIIIGEISLKEIKERFERFRDNAKSLDVEMKIALESFPNEEDIGTVLHQRIDQIKQSHKLSECSDAAETILDFKDAMGLKGNFQALKDFLDQTNEAFHWRTLDTISKDVLEMGRALEQLTQPQIKCLRTVINCKEYIFWLREEVKGRDEVKTLVDLAMMSAGESDIETDRVSCLHTTALGFAPFIFDLDEHIGFGELMNICERVWKEIGENDTLPEKLESINGYLEWLKGVKDAHAMSSLELAQSINERGVYCIGHLDTVTITQTYEKKTVDSVVKLLLPSANNDEVTFKEYSLEKLQELQSKLALISGKRSSGQEDVDRFGQILQGVVQLGQAYVNLCEIGVVSHVDWNKKYECRSTLSRNIIDDIECQAQEFERLYEACKLHINEQRMKYRELNHFTTQQLLFLRKQLAAVKHSAAVNFLSVQVYALLEKIVPDIHPATLENVFLDAGIVLQNDSYSDGSSDHVSLPECQEVVNHRADDEQVEIVEIYESLLSKVEKLNCSEAERLAVAALVDGLQRSVVDLPDLLVWCFQNQTNDDIIDDLYEKAKKNPVFAGIVNEVAGSEYSQSSEDSEDDDISSSEDGNDEAVDSNRPEDIVLDETKGGTYLSLKEMGVFLFHLSSHGERDVRRRFPSYLERGKPNLILARKEHIFPAVLGLYMEDGSQSLPTCDEVLICTSDTTSEEVELLWRRALAEIGEKLYCLVHGDLLDYDVSQKAVDCLHTLMHDYHKNETFGLVVLCSSENEERAHIVAALGEYRVTGIPRYPRPEELRRYLANQFKAPQQRPGSYCDQHVIWSAAADVDRAGNLNVRVVTSTESGVGKSLVVQRLAEQVAYLPNNLLITEGMKGQNQEPPPLCVTIPFHDKHAHAADVVGFFLPHAIHSDLPLSRIFHLDSSCAVTPDLDTLLFNLMILGELTDDRGRVWRRNPYDLYILEITHASRQKQEKTPTSCRFFELLPSIVCLRPKETVARMGREAQKGSPLFDDKEFKREAVQRVWQYLRLFNEDPDLIQQFYFDAQRTEGSPKECIKTLIRNCGVRNPSWSEIRYFINFLNYQLRDCEQSEFCNPEFTGDTLEGFRIFVVAFMVIMSKDFSMRSLKGEEDLPSEQTDDANEESDIRPLQLRRRWERSIHPYIFFNPDHVTLTFLGFQVDPDGNMLDSQGRIIQERLMPRRLRTGLHVQNVDLSNNFESTKKDEKIETLCKVMGIKWAIDPDESYELTSDNVKKMLAIHMRFRCDIPVVIMGETGCGKTRLIRYMCGLQTMGIKEHKNLLLMKIHGGTTFKDIEKNVVHAEAMAVKNGKLNVDTVMFFDEANTTEALGMIKEIMVDRKCNGRPLSSESNRLKFIVACNPYRRHTKEMIQKLESAGLGYHVRADETTERLGRIPLRQLVYRVHALPESMCSLVWDFGRLQPDVEEQYIQQIVGRYVLHEQRLPGDEELVKTISKILAVSQQFMGNRQDECSFVSLRDVKRAMDVMVWFYEHYKDFTPLLGHEEHREKSEDDSGSEEEESEEKTKLSDHSLAQKVFFVDEMSMLEGVPQSPPVLLTDEEIDVVQFTQDTLSDDIDRVTWSLILALGVCYQARLQKRDDYREAVAKAFTQPCRLPGGPDRIEREINQCQQAVMSQLKLGPNIACNTALSENVFMMVVCIELRIPLFVVGKPGSSKSLAKTVVADNMQGDDSPSDLFKSFKQIQLISYQCSPQSTPQGILTTFQQCSELQDQKRKETKVDRFASVVVLDEVGLAEDSPKMPLKTLHPLLEDSDKNDDDVIETEDSFSRVAFIGLSNWALDPAKMNRGIMLSRNEPSESELEGTARGICGNDPDIMLLVEHLISPLVAAYVDLYNKQKTLKRLKDGKKDEFFGLRDFYSLVKMVIHIAKQQKRSPDWQELEHAIRRNFGGLLEEDFNPVSIIKTHLGFPSEFLQNEEDHLGLDCLSLIQASLDRESFMGEGRFLLILTENFAALPRIKQLLLEEDSEEPYVIFGSSFPKDQLFTQVCRNINRVKICMETGRTVILLNLENLYESLYDALNQYYVSFGGEKYVDLGLGNHRVKCRVHKKFRLIVIAEKDVVYNKFPIPLINRMEKHFLVMSSGLTEAQKQVTKKLEAWVEDFASVILPPHERTSREFKKGDAFIGYHEDCVPAVVLQVCAELHEDGSGLSEENRETWEENVLKWCQERLLQCATPDSVIRLRSSRLVAHAGTWWTTYFREQEHSSLANFLVKSLDDVQSRGTNSTALRAQISTHSRLLSDRDIPKIAKAVGLSEGCVKAVSLQQFQTEQQFCNCIGREFFAKLGGRESLLIVQCDSTDRTMDLVACARHLLIEECREMEKELDEDSIGFSHILMIVQLARVAGGCPDFVGVQGEGWLSVHIDELCPPIEEIPLIQAMTGRSVSQIFESALNKTEDNLTVRQVLTSCVQEAASRIEDDETTLGRATRRVELMINLLSPKTSTPQREGRFEMVLAERLYQLLEQKDQRSHNEGNEWLDLEARSGALQETGTFKKALWRRFQSAVAPILAEVIAYVDRDGNLELAASEDPWVVDLWLKILRDSSVTELCYADFFFTEGDASVLRSKVPVLKSGYRLHSFQCSLPFSWLLKERIDELFRDARSVAANSHESDTECLRRLLNNSEVKSILSEAISEGGEAVVARYLQDFTHMTYKPQDEDELEVIQRAITAAAKEIHDSKTSGDRFEMDLAVVHTAHSRIQQRLNWLALLLQAKPDILPDLVSSFSWDENEMNVDAIALQMCLERMEPRAEDVEETSRRQKWCDEVLSIKVAVEAMVGKRSGSEAYVGEKTEGILTQCRCMWQRLSAVRMFIEHVYPSHADPEDVQTILKLLKALGDRTDFSKKESLDVIERFLLCCSEDSIERLQADKPEDHVKYLQRCNAFFMDIVSVFCFGEDIRNLDPEVFDMLMRYVVGTESETKQFSPFPGYGMDNSPVVRSFLLQQLINSSDEKAKKHLERFLYKAQGLSSEVPHVLNVCLLTVQCMENSWASSYAKNADLELSISIGIVTKLCQGALHSLESDFTSSDEMQVSSLEAIAKARYALDKTAEFMYMSVVSGDERWSNPETRGVLNCMFTAAQQLCTSGRSRSPALFLLKQLVKRYGVHSIATISQTEEFNWIVPDEFRQRLDEGMTLDRFLTYGECYRKVRDTLAGALLSENMDELIALLKALEDIPTHAKDIILLLALYREVAVPQRAAKDQQAHTETFQMIKDVILRRGGFLSPNARSLASAILENSQEMGFLILQVPESQSEIEKALPEVLIHATSVLQCINFDKLLEPLSAILLTQSGILNSFLPTMPEDSFHEARLAIVAREGDFWYECPAGHRYIVGDCGKPTERRKCPDCPETVEIGGEGHIVVETNRRIDTTERGDRSNTGHILGEPQKTIAERDLSPAIVSLLRVILHSAMLVGGFRQPEVLQQLIVPEVPAEGVCDFIWRHLGNDVRNLSTNLERSADEVLLAIHLVLSQIVDRATSRPMEPFDYERTSFWSTKEERRNWENEFCNVFVQPIVKNLEERLQNFYAVSVNDRRLGNDPLMREVYEVDALTPPRTAADIHPGHAAFWKYRTRVTVDLVIRNFQDVKSNLATCKILGKFFDEEHKLRALYYLPDIVALQRILTDRFHRRIDKERANQLRIRNFLQDLPKGQKEKVSKLFQSFGTAWDLVRHQLSSQGRFAPTREQCLNKVEKNSTVSVLLPSSEGPGICCKGLMFFLVNAHNELVQAYNSSGITRSESVVSLSEVSASQLIAYDSEKDLLPVILANCSYSLEVGRETQLQYNWEALEKQIIDRFIRGRPRVEFEVNDFMFREDVRYDFAELKFKIPQEPISGHVRTQILSEFKDVRDVSDVLSTLEIVISFLSTSGGNPEMSISEYCSNVLLLTEGKARLKSKKAQQNCTLSNILDLWRTLALARARLLLKNKQDPFDQVPDCFKTEMPSKMMTRFSGALRKVDVELFLSKVIEVISLRLAEEDKETGEMGLNEYLSGYFEENGEDFADLDEIPDEACVKHVIYAWQLALELSEQQKGRRRRSMMN